MKVQEILLDNIQQIYQGYQLDSICKTKWNEQDVSDIWKGQVVELKRIPAKISRFFDKKKIKRLWKTTCEKDRMNNWYFILTTDNTMFEAHY